MALSAAEQRKWIAYLDLSYGRPDYREFIVQEFEQKLDQRTAPLSSVLMIAQEHGLSLDQDVQTVVQDDCLYIKVPLPLPAQSGDG